MLIKTGKPVEGIERLSGLPRGTEALGRYKERSSDVPITTIRLAIEMPAAERPAFEYMDERSAATVRPPERPAP